MCLHIPSLKKKKREQKEVRGGLVEPKVQPSLLGFLLSYSLACWIVDVVHMFGGEISNEFAIGDVRDLPHTYSCTYLYSKEKQKWKQEGLCQGLITGSQNFIESKNVFIWNNKFLFYFILYFYFMLLYIYFSWQAK